MRDYQGVFLLPCTRLGIVVDQNALLALDFLLDEVPARPPSTRMAQRVWEELAAYLADPDHVFSVPLKLAGTPFQQRVWQQIAKIPPGATIRYGDIAQALHTSHDRLAPLAALTLCRWSFHVIEFWPKQAWGVSMVRLAI